MSAQPDIRLTNFTENLAGIMDGKINPTSDCLQLKIHVIGAMEDLLKMQ